LIVGNPKVWSVRRFSSGYRWHRFECC